jgi:MoaA/NifB/PqqE/SkfB family radical SAM enzyme
MNNLVSSYPAATHCGHLLTNEDGFPAVVRNKAELRQLKIKLLGRIYRKILQKGVNPMVAATHLIKIYRKYRSIFGEPMITKAAKSDGRYFWRLASPGFPSEAWDRMTENEIERGLNTGKRYGLRSLIFAITKKCPMNCEHCFEWYNLNKQDVLAVPDIINIVHKYQDYGTTQIMFSGGEPMLRMNDLKKVLQHVKGGTDFWIITSGYGLDRKQAEELKSSGLTGVMVSLDHFEASEHDRFRGFDGAFNMAVRGAIHAKRAGLATALGLCLTREFVSDENLRRYMEMAKGLGVAFVQFLEPRSSGRYSGKNVELTQKETAILEKTYLEYNSSGDYIDFPIINYLGYHQRHVGCFGAGDRFFYIDPDGDAHICPYCTGKMGNTLTFSVEEIIAKLSKQSCHVFVRNTAL